VFYLLRKDCKELFGSKKRIGIIVIVLIILIISTYYNITKHEEDKTSSMIQFGVVDKDSSVYSKLLLEYFNKSESFHSYIHIVEGKSDEIEKAFYNGKLDIYLEIPENFAENMIYLKHLPVKVFINATDTTKAIFLKNILESYEKYISAVEVNCVALYDTMVLSGMDSELINKKNIEISYDLIFTALGKENFFLFQENSDFPSTTILNYYIYAIISMAFVYSGLYVGFLMMKERKQGTLKRLHTIGIPIGRILFEKTIFSSAVIFTIIYMTYLIPTLFKGDTINIKMGIVYLCAVLFCVSLAILLSGVFRKIQNYMIVGNFLGFIFCIIGGGIIPIMYMPTELVDLAKYTPNYWFIKVMLSVQKQIINGLFLKIVLGLLISTFLFYILSWIAYCREEVCFEE